MAGGFMLEACQGNRTEVKIYAYTGNETKIGAELALKNKLFVPEWELSHHLHFAKSEAPLDFLPEAPEYKIILASFREKHIGICLLKILNTQKITTIQIFVKERYRRNRVGTKLVEEAKKHTSHSLRWSMGTLGSRTFFINCGLQDTELSVTQYINWIENNGGVINETYLPDD